MKIALLVVLSCICVGVFCMPDACLGENYAANWKQLQTGGLNLGANGFVVAVDGGFVAFESSFGQGSVYSADKNQWVQFSKSSAPPARHAFAAVGMGKTVYLFGGCAGSSDCNVVQGDTWQFDVASLTWKQVSSAQSPAARYDASFSSAISGVLLFGGRNGKTVYDDVWMFNVTSGAWQQECGACSPQPTGRYGAAFAQSAGDDSALSFGGIDATGTALNDTWHFYVDTPPAWESMHSVTPTPTSRSFASFVSVNVNLNVLIGGVLARTGAPANDVWLYSPFCLTQGALTPNGGGWSPATNAGRSIPVSRSRAAVETTDDGSILLSGGVDSAGRVLSDVWQLTFS